jgi:sterol desaturase/sphingolipid hydroxylase (fatty acid hydroxylase superfamily)
VPEHLIFRGHPALPFVLAMPAIGFFLERAPPLDPLASVGIFALGALAWTLVEYAMHRFLFHLRRAKTIAFIVHGHHHVSPRELSRLAATPVQLGSLALLLAGFWQLALPSAWTLAMAGTLSGYLAYEALHHVAHHETPKNALVRALARHHLKHHYEHPDACFGISSPLWDWIFRTSR